MLIGGFVKNSFVDYPGKIACAIFTVGCNMRCWYCHNSHLLSNVKKIIDEKEIFLFLSSHKSFIEGVVVSGGEPTLQPDLIDFIKKIKDIGYQVKLDTNGTNFEVLKDLCNKNLVDYVAMDIKAPLKKYKKITQTNDDLKNINMSINLLLQNKVEYEFRTTFSPDLSLDDIEEIGKLVEGAKNFSIQKYNNVEYNKINMLPRKKEDHISAQNILKKYVKNVVVKGLSTRP